MIDSRCRQSPGETPLLESRVRRARPAHVFVGAYQGVASPVRAPTGFSYLLVTLKHGETRTYHLRTKSGSTPVFR